MTESETYMPDWSQHDLHPHMNVYSSDNQNLGHIAKAYEVSFLSSVFSKRKKNRLLTCIYMT